MIRKPVGFLVRNSRDRPLTKVTAIWAVAAWRQRGSASDNAGWPKSREPGDCWFRSPDPARAVQWKAFVRRSRPGRSFCGRRGRRKTPDLLQPIHLVPDVSKHGGLARQRVRGPHHQVVDSQRAVFLQPQGAGHGVLPARPPLLTQFLEVVDLSPALPIDVDRAQGLGPEDARSEILSEIGEQEYRIGRSGCTRPGG